MTDKVFERNLPLCLAHGLEARERGVEKKSCQFYITYRAARCETQFVATA